MSICIEGLNFLEDASSIEQFIDHPSVLEFPILCGLEEAVSMSLYKLKKPVIDFILLNNLSWQLC